ncbi:hypothetical protein [Gracilibacillus alcaliphilus]|uniref:hypothetical protein n=1 Tax=Gracilibacillus alcaliphilus TaxID=1401441 RepID=UPI00195A3504|nr:hypothetical protein [Gracilibacillus alcaliphilus]MBM7675337.1 hypothetical protein [Gracilibacillus alcaliphilus]
MLNEVSVFIMDVRNSSKENIGNELSEYLQQLKDRIAEWTENIVVTKISHRAGDELAVICSGYASAYTLAFYISQIWRFADHKPYFGLSFGHIQEDLSAINLETWIHPLMKQARNANDYLKRQPNNTLFRFELPSLSTKQGFTVFNKQFETLINTSLTLKQEQINEQTDIQSLVCSLYLIVGQQNKVSQYLGRTTATISTHIKKGKTPVILHAFYDIVKTLDSLESQEKPPLTDKLQTNIRQHVRNHLNDYLPKEGRLS